MPNKKKDQERLVRSLLLEVKLTLKLAKPRNLFATILVLSSVPMQKLTITSLNAARLFKAKPMTLQTSFTVLHQRYNVSLFFLGQLIFLKSSNFMIVWLHKSSEMVTSFFNQVNFWITNSMLGLSFIVKKLFLSKRLKVFKKNHAKNMISVSHNSWNKRKNFSKSKTYLHGESIPKIKLRQKE